MHCGGHVQFFDSSISLSSLSSATFRALSLQSPFDNMTGLTNLRSLIAEDMSLERGEEDSEAFSHALGELHQLTCLWLLNCTNLTFFTTSKWDELSALQHLTLRGCNLYSPMSHI